MQIARAITPMTTFRIQPGTGLVFGPTWCSWRTNTVSTMESDVIAMVTVRYIPATGEEGNVSVMCYLY